MWCICISLYRSRFGSSFQYSSVWQNVVYMRFPLTEAVLFHPFSTIMSDRMWCICISLLPKPFCFILSVKQCLTECCVYAFPSTEADLVNPFSKTMFDRMWCICVSLYRSRFGSAFQYSNVWQNVVCMRFSLSKPTCNNNCMIVFMFIVYRANTLYYYNTGLGHCCTDLLKLNFYDTFVISKKFHKFISQKLSVQTSELFKIANL